MKVRRRRRFLLVALGLLLLLFAIIFFTLAWYRPPTFIRHFEAEAYGRETPFVEPESVRDGLAVYAVGEGRPVLLFPYPHGHTTEPMAQSPIARLLVEAGRTVITFDVPGAYRSTREPDGTMAEMVRSADETLARLDLEGPIDVVGHSMGGLAALAYAVERPHRTLRLVLANSVSGFPAAARCGFPGSAFGVLEADFWRVIIWGMRINAGRADLAQHKRLLNLMTEVSYHDRSRFTPVPITDADGDLGVPIRMIWARNMYAGLSYADRLGDVTAPTLVLAGRHDPQAGLSCSQELSQGIADARLVVFEESGHFPFSEETARFREIIGAFLNGDQTGAVTETRLLAPGGERATYPGED